VPWGAESGSGTGNNGTTGAARVENRTALILFGHFDHEATPTYPVSVVAVDTGTPTPLRTVSHFALTVDDVNEPPTDVWVNPRMVGEYVAESERPLRDGDAIGTFSVQDPDANDPHTVTIVRQVSARIVLMLSGLDTMDCALARDNQI
jgi:hypothetical protein